MGCDIHTFIEKKVNGKWEPIFLYRIDGNHPELAYPYNGRNYELFSILAGVRGWHNALVDLRGLPTDISEGVSREYDWWGNDAHSMTWYDLFELSLFEKEHRNEEGYEYLTEFYNSIRFYLNIAQEYVYNLEPNQYRVIMWFDN